MSLQTMRWNRRLLLRNLLLGAAAAPLLRAHAGAAPRRHLINIVVRGGWDSFWFHNAVRASEVLGAVATTGALVVNGAFVQPPGSSNYRGILGPARVLSDDAPVGSPFHIRFPDSFSRPHPHQPTALLGPGFSGFLDAELSNFCIWRGIRSEGGHDTGNRILQTGTTGDQTSAFPALVAAELAAKRGLRPLHYTQLATSRMELCNQMGPLSLADPVMIPDLGTWENLTAPSAREFSTKRRSLLDATFSRLASHQRLRQASNQVAYDSFASSHDGAISLMSSGHAKGQDFVSTLADYRGVLTALATSQPMAQWFPLAKVDVEPLVFRFALAEFLVTHDLAAVVDLPGLTMDFHTENDSDVMVMLANLTGMQLLVRRLKAAPAPEGGTMLDHTTVVMHTEMERTPFLMPNHVDPSRAGTGHGDSATSAFLAGVGIAGGRVVGEFARPAGQHTTAEYGVAPFAPLPIDLATGNASLAGQLVGVRSLFSTMLQSFGAVSRSQLQLQAPVVTALLA